MSRAAFSLMVFGIHISGLSILLLVAPNIMLRISGFPPTQEVSA